jgi:uncharacterized protein YbjT (DUF2867 family)
MRRVLVTGATGTIGAPLVGRLRERGVPVRAFVRDAVKAGALLGDGVELAFGDFAAPATLWAALDGITDVFLATPNHPAQLSYETAVIDAAVAAGVPRLVKLSAIGAQVGSPLAFWDCHGRSEQHLNGARIAAIVLRPSFYMSNLIAAACRVRDTGSLFAPADGARIAMVDPGDVAASAAAALSEGGHDGETVALTGPAAITYDDVSETLSATTGRHVRFVSLPDDAAQSGMIAAGMPEWAAANLVVLFRLLRDGAGAQTSDGVRRLAGRAPRSFAAFAREHAAAFGDEPVVAAPPIHPEAPDRPSATSQPEMGYFAGIREAGSAWTDGKGNKRAASVNDHAAWRQALRRRAAG